MYDILRLNIRVRLLFYPKHIFLDNCTKNIFCVKEDFISNQHKELPKQYNITRLLYYICLNYNHKKSFTNMMFLLYCFNLLNGSSNIRILSCQANEKVQNINFLV